MMAKLHGSIAFIITFFLFFGLYEARRVAVALKAPSTKLNELEDLFWRISDPSHADYGRHLSLQQLRDYVGLPDDHLESVSSWLKSEGARWVDVHPAKDWLVVEIPDEHAAKLSHRVPSHLADFIELIELLPSSSKKSSSRFPQDSSSSSSRRRSYVPSKLAENAQMFSPNVQKQIYQQPQSLKATNPKNSQLVYGTGTYGVSKSDVASFYQHFDVDNDASLITQSGYPGDPDGDNFGEGTLDTEYISAMGMGVPTIVENNNNTQDSEGGAGFGPAFLSFMMDLAQQQSPPLVVSLSLGSLSWSACDILCKQASAQDAYSYSECLKYAQDQFQVCMYTSADQENRLHMEFMKLGARGVSILAATGDGGNHFSFGPFSPLSGLGRSLNKISCQYSLPTFPAASPFVTGVGATQMESGNPIGCSYESGCAITGGGGFAWQFGRPSYQDSVVSAYLSKSGSYQFQFNSSGRAYPDVSAIGSAVPIVLNGRVLPVDGTSCSAPEVAGMISLINDARLNAGKSPLGFLNPALYQLAAAHPGEAFVDVTSGSTACGAGGLGSGNPCCASGGFLASPGWDAMSGLGQPLFGGMMKYLS